MKNNLKDLNNILFAQLEALADDDLKGEELQKEIKRADALTKVSRDIINVADLQLKAIQMQYDYHLKSTDLTELTYNKNEKAALPGVSV